MATNVEKLFAALPAERQARIAAKAEALREDEMKNQTLYPSTCRYTLTRLVDLLSDPVVLAAVNQSDYLTKRVNDAVQAVDHLVVLLQDVQEAQNAKK